MTIVVLQMSTRVRQCSTSRLQTRGSQLTSLQFFCRIKGLLVPLRREWLYRHTSAQSLLAATLVGIEVNVKILL